MKDLDNMKHWAVVATLTIAALLISCVSGQTNNEPPAQGSTNMDCVGRIEIPHYPPLAAQAQIDGSITASVALSSDGAVHGIQITAESKYRQAGNLFGPPVEKVIGAAQFRSGCSEKTIQLVFHFDLKAKSDSPKTSMYFVYPNVFWIVSEAPLVQPEAQASVTNPIPASVFYFNDNCCVFIGQMLYFGH